MGILDTFKHAFPNISYGYSDHTAEVSDAPVQAVCMGGTVIEKHITLDKTMDGPDHFFALEPQELKQMVSDIRKTEVLRESGECTIDPVIYGNTEKKCYPHEKYLRDFAYMTLFSRKDIREGEPIHPEDLVILRKGKKEKGLEPKYFELFSLYEIKAKKDIRCEDPITWETIL